VADALLFDARLVENPIQPLRRPMEKQDFDAPVWLKAARIAANVPRAVIGLFALARRMRRGGYDLLYCNGLYAVIVGGLLARFGRVPVLWHLHDTSIPDALAGVFGWMAESKRVRLILCVSQSSAGMVPFVPDKVHVVLNAIDLDEFDATNVTPALRKEAHWPDNAIIFGSHGRVVARKGYVTMVRAARIALDRATSALRERMKFAVIGDTPADHPGDHLADCRALVTALGLDGQFVFPGYRRDVRPYVADYDVCIVPSIFAEPFGLTVIESYAFGVPVIASAVGGLPEIVKEGETGMLVPPSDPEALAAAILLYAEDADRRRTQGATARAYVAEHHDARRYAARVQDLVLSACGPLETAP
jgi:glycosyltransferase involved in cell wall biosynthesis